jgi:hypothetical protein
MRIVRATTEAEVDAALKSADKIFVEGDDRLLSYAVSKAEGDPEKFKIEFEPPPPDQDLPRLKRLERRVQTASKLCHILLIIVLFLLACLGAAGIALVIIRGGGAGHGNIPALVQMLVWPTVAALAIVALFLIAWKAITRGQNIEISWKLTEKFTGRVVITKVKTRRATPKSRAAAA